MGQWIVLTSWSLIQQWDIVSQSLFLRRVVIQILTSFTLESLKVGIRVTFRKGGYITQKKKGNESPRRTLESWLVKKTKRAVWEPFARMPCRFTRIRMYLAEWSTIWGFQCVKHQTWSSAFHLAKTVAFPIFDEQHYFHSIEQSLHSPEPALIRPNGLGFGCLNI